MNFCCHDDFTNEGVFRQNHVRVLTVYENYLASQGVAPTLQQLNDAYAAAVANGEIPALDNRTDGESAEILVLPTFDCVDYTHEGVVRQNHVRIFTVYENYLASQGVAPSLQELRDAYTSAVSNGEIPALDNRADGEPAIILHLPSLEADTQVITDEGLVDKCDTGAVCTCSAVVETGVLKVDFDASELTGGNGDIKGVEIVFDNVTFGAKAGLSGGNAIINNNFKDTNNAATLDFYYDYSIRSTSVNDIETEPNKTKSVIGFIDTTQGGTGAAQSELSSFQFSVESSSFTQTGDNPIIADVRVYDSSAEVVQYDITRCGE